MRLPARTKDRILLHHTTEVPAHGHRGIDLHLGQKPKLGWRYAGITHSLHITISGYVYILVSLLMVASNMRKMIFGEVLSKKQILG